MKRLDMAVELSCTNYLRELANGRLPQNFPNLGICSALTMHIESMMNTSFACGYLIVERLSKDWEHHSGSVAWPVPSSEAEVRNKINAKWSNPLRLDLCNYIADRLEKGDDYWTKSIDEGA